MKIRKIIKSTGYSILLLMALCQGTIVPTMAQTEITKSTLNRPVNKSELSLIKNIKMACSALASESNNPRNIAAKFGRIIESSEKYNLDLKPFNRDLNLIYILVSDEPPHTANIISFVLKPQKKISIASLQKSFGVFRGGVPKRSYRVVWFDVDSSISGVKKCPVSVEHLWRPKDISLSQIYTINVHFSNIK